MWVGCEDGTVQSFRIAGAAVGQHLATVTVGFAVRQLGIMTPSSMWVCGAAGSICVVDTVNHTTRTEKIVSHAGSHISGFLKVRRTETSTMWTWSGADRALRVFHHGAPLASDILDQLAEAQTKAVAYGGQYEAVLQMVQTLQSQTGQTAEALKTSQEKARDLETQLAAARAEKESLAYENQSLQDSLAAVKADLQASRAQLQRSTTEFQIESEETGRTLTHLRAKLADALAAKDLLAGEVINYARQLNVHTAQERVAVLERAAAVPVPWTPRPEAPRNSDTRLLDDSAVSEGSRTRTHTPLSGRGISPSTASPPPPVSGPHRKKPKKSPRDSAAQVVVPVAPKLSTDDAAPRRGRRRLKVAASTSDGDVRLQQVPRKQPATQLHVFRPGSLPWKASSTRASSRPITHTKGVIRLFSAPSPPKQRRPGSSSSLPGAVSSP
eukprot:NODE_1420_length_1424_cov_14.741818_g1182_i0.p1 GENE.NODE_1420_length_1424_cov_14.741818_g1182_i0~~NODE_1420_length_1424_cov_14.741818_g1182_i0.p1  ORF type:complete len:459 (-),score=67.11 NODE_1420_length_1424_cov_14.741818_g1182_i0:48-1367(-)